MEELSKCCNAPIEEREESVDSDDIDAWGEEAFMMPLPETYKVCSKCKSQV